MAVRAVNTCSIFRSASSSPPLSAFRCRLHHFVHFQSRRHQKSSIRFRIFRSEKHLLGHAGVRSFSVQSFVDSVIEELEATRRRKRVSATSKMGVKISGELLQDKLEKQALQQGLLLEFKKDSDRVLLAVAQKPDGKKNWMVSDQVLVETTNAAC